MMFSILLNIVNYKLQRKQSEVNPNPNPPSAPPSLAPNKAKYKFTEGAERVIA